MKPQHLTIDQLVAPRENFSYLIYPEINEQVEVLLQAEVGNLDPKWQTRRYKAKEEVFAIARKYDAELREISGESKLREESHNIDLEIKKPWVVTGHQPEFMHPGVWLKNFVAAEIAGRGNYCSINLIVDYDQLKHHSFSYPEVDNESGMMETKRMDFTRASVTALCEFAPAPHESEIETFLKEIRELNAKLPEEVMLAELTVYDLVLIARQSSNLGQFVTLLRKKFELQLGVENIDVPVSWLCKTESFQEFLVELVQNSKELSQIYNDVLKNYREQNNIRNAVQPMPDLIVENDGIFSWQELPFWLVNMKEKTREGLYCHVDQQVIRLKGAAGKIIEVPMEQGTSTDLISYLKKADYEIRPRALMLTMFARMYFANLFIHGLGGGKYDQMTDEIIRRFYRVEPAPFSIVTGTCWLPITDKPLPDIKKLRKEKSRLQQEIRKVTFQPEYFINGSSEELKEIAELKQVMYERKLGPKIHLSQRSKIAQRLYYQPKYRRLKTLRAGLSSQVQPLLDELGLQLDNIESDIEQQKIMQNREYPAWLFSRETMLKFFQESLKSNKPPEVMKRV